jgi:hypothetical protein
LNEERPDFADAGTRKENCCRPFKTLVDVDYADQLSDAKTRLACELLKGRRLAGETQVFPLDTLRASDAVRKRVLRSEGVLVFDQHRADRVDEVESYDARPKRAAWPYSLREARVRRARPGGGNYVEDYPVAKLGRAARKHQNLR